MPIRGIAPRDQKHRQFSRILLSWVFAVGVTAFWSGEIARAQTLSRVSYEHIVAVQTAIEKAEYDRAEVLLDKLLASRLQSATRAFALQLSSHVHAARGDYRGAAQALEDALATKALNATADRDVRFNLARMYLADGNLERCIAVLETWFEEARNPTPQAYMVLAQAYAQKRDYDKALAPAKRAIELLGEPREGWYQFLLSLHYQLGHTASMADVLQIMVSHWPDRDRYWRQLAWTYGALEDWSKMLAVLELAYKRDHINDETELVTLARLYLQQGVPVRAARVLKTGLSSGRVEKSVENLRILADALARAEDKYAVVDVLEQATRMPEGKALHLRLARAYLANDQWRRAAKSARSAIESGPSKQKGYSLLVLGIAEYKAGKIEAAREALAESARHRETRTAAASWLNRLPPAAPDAP